MNASQNRPDSSVRSLIISKQRIQRTFSRLAYEVVERNQGIGGLILFGILKKGLSVGHELSRHIEIVTGEVLQVHPLDVEPYRDDRQLSSPSTVSGGVDVSGKNVIMVDDVLYTGRTARAALDAIIRYGRPARIQLMVLVDRGHREYPIRPDYVGQKVQTKYNERVEVDIEGSYAIYQQE